MRWNERPYSTSTSTNPQRLPHKGGSPLRGVTSLVKPQANASKHPDIFSIRQARSSERDFKISINDSRTTKKGERKRIILQDIWDRTVLSKLNTMCLIKDRNFLLWIIYLPSSMAHGARRFNRSCRALKLKMSR